MVTLLQYKSSFRTDLIPPPPGPPSCVSPMGGPSPLNPNALAALPNRLPFCSVLNGVYFVSCTILTSSLK